MWVLAWVSTPTTWVYWLATMVISGSPFGRAFIAPIREEARRGSSLTSHGPNLLAGRTTFYQAIGVGQKGAAPTGRTCQKQDTAVAGQKMSESHPAGVAPVCQPAPGRPISLEKMTTVRESQRTKSERSIQMTELVRSKQF